MNKKKNTRVLILTIVILLLIIGFFEMLPGIRYKMAMKKLESGDYDSAYKTLKSLGKKDVMQNRILRIGGSGHSVEKSTPVLPM
ncbi:MAG: hypothetical protein IKS10_02595 [Lachnospiraceae bacterium]|nr:hypothetical protein [Lachnospiraceae bacterium]